MPTTWVGRSFSFPQDTHKRTILAKPGQIQQSYSTCACAIRHRFPVIPAQHGKVAPTPHDNN